MLEEIARSHILLVILFLLVTSAMLAFVLAKRRARSLAAWRTLNALPADHGIFLFFWTLAPGLVVLLAHAVAAPVMADNAISGALVERLDTVSPLQLEAYLDGVLAQSSGARVEIPEDDPALPLLMDLAVRRIELVGVFKLVAAIFALAASAAGAMSGAMRLQNGLEPRRNIERLTVLVFAASSALALAVTAGIVFSLALETLRFFSSVSPWSFFFGLNWSPQAQAVEGILPASSAYGAVSLVWGTVMTSLIAMLVAVPVGLMSAIYLSEYAGSLTRSIVKPALEVLAGVPTVVYGFFAIVTVAPVVQWAGDRIDALLMITPWLNAPVIDAQPVSALAAGLVMGVMIIPFMCSLSDDVLSAVPDELRAGAMALGATPSEMVRGVILPSALPGVAAAGLLALSRAVGETMIVVMAAGQRAQITLNPFSDVTTITAQIVGLLTGDTEFDTPQTQSAFALGFALFATTLIFNMGAQRLVRAYRRRYD